MRSPEYGVQAFLWWRVETAHRDLGLARDAGFTWVKQVFAWSDIEPLPKHYDFRHSDRVVYMANEFGLDILARLDFPPKWAQANCPAQGPPKNSQDFADFAFALASRYKGRIRAYAIWNEPNLAREWCGRTPNAAEYVELLKAGYQAIKRADPEAWVVSAGLTPTGTQPPVAIPDDVYLEQMYQAGAKNYFDILGVHAAGYRAPPEVSPDEAAANKEAYGGERFFTFRRVEDLRRIMVKYGDENKQVAVLEFGWTSDPRPDSPYSWHAVTEEQKGAYAVRAYQWAKKNWAPWIGVMILIYIADPDWTKEREEYWWAITEPWGSPRAAYFHIKKMPK